MTYDVISVKMLAGSDSQLVTAVHVGDEAAQRLRSIGRWYGNRRDGSRASASDETSLLSRARKITMFLVAAAAFVWLCTRMGGGGEYSAVGQGD